MAVRLVAFIALAALVIAAPSRITLEQGKGGELVRPARCVEISCA